MASPRGNYGYADKPRISAGFSLLLIASLYHRSVTVSIGLRGGSSDQTADDRLEGLAMAVDYWTEQMDRYDKVAADRALERLMDEELDRYLEYMVVVGQQSQHDNSSWFEDWDQ